VQRNDEQTDGTCFGTMNRESPRSRYARASPFRPRAGWTRSFTLFSVSIVHVKRFGCWRAASQAEAWLVSIKRESLGWLAGA